MIYLDMENRRKITLTGYNYYKTGELHPDRILSEHDFLYLTDGEWEIFENDCSYKVRQDTLLILQANKHHYSKLPCCDNTGVMFIHAQSVQTDTKTEGLICLPNFIDCSNYPNIKRYFKETVNEYLSNSKSLKASAFFDILIDEIAGLSQNKTPQINDVIIFNIIHIIHNSPDKFFSLDELAKKHYISVRTLTSKFKQCTNDTLYNYQLNFKLKNAQAIIKKEPNRSIDNIARSLGFYDGYHFSKLYKKAFGYPPSLERIKSENEHKKTSI